MSLTLAQRSSTTSLPACPRAATSWVLSLVALAIAFLLVPVGCGDKPEPFVSTVGAADIVSRNTQDGLALLFDANTDTVALGKFRDATAAAKTRDDLRKAWAAEDSLAKKAPSFLDANVFAHAEKEAKWPKSASAAELEPIYVKGVRDGVEQFVRGVK
jgi:myosin-crossreactive antigen